jgi:microcystin degradation protein MlrC
MLRLAVARLRFCSNSFVPRRTRGEDVALHEWHSGAASFDQPGGVLPEDGGSELDGVRRFLAARPDWQATVLRSASAPPGGPLTGAMFSSWLSEVEAGLRRGRFDAVYLSLHGACQAEGDPAADVTILRRVRSIMGPLPVVASFDWRANLSEEVAILLDGATSNRPNRRGSEAEAASKALALLENIVNGTHRPVGALARLPMVMVGGEAQLYDMLDTELSTLRPPVVAASVFTGFAWGDSPFTGPSALVWADRDAAMAREMAARLALMVSRAPRIAGEAPIGVERGLYLAADAAAANAAAANGSGATLPTLLLDPADDPCRGGLMDTPGLLRGLQRAQAFNHLPGRALFAALHDPEIIAAARDLGLGATLSGNFGGQTTAAYGPSVPVVGKVVTMGRMGDGGEFVTLRAGLLDILVLGKRPQVITPELLVACGCDLSGLHVLAIKGGTAVQNAFAGRIGLAVPCDCPGPSNPDLLQLPYHFVPSIRRAISVDERHAAGLEAELAADRPRRRSEERRGSLVGQGSPNRA